MSHQKIGAPGHTAQRPAGCHEAGSWPGIIVGCRSSLQSATSCYPTPTAMVIAWGSDGVFATPAFLGHPNRTQGRTARRPDMASASPLCCRLAPPQQQLAQPLAGCSRLPAARLGAPQPHAHAAHVQRNASRATTLCCSAVLLGHDVSVSPVRGLRPLPPGLLAGRLPEQPPQHARPEGLPAAAPAPAVDDSGTAEEEDEMMGEDLQEVRYKAYNSRHFTMRRCCTLLAHSPAACPTHCPCPPPPPPLTHTQALTHTHTRTHRCTHVRAMPLQTGRGTGAACCERNRLPVPGPCAVPAWACMGLRGKRPLAAMP